MPPDTQLATNQEVEEIQVLGSSAANPSEPNIQQSADEAAPKMPMPVASIILQPPITGAIIQTSADEAIMQPSVDEATLEMSVPDTSVIPLAQREAQLKQVFFFTLARCVILLLTDF